jgi:hypothetical protein
VSRMHRRVMLMMVVMGLVLAFGGSGYLLAGSRRAVPLTPSTPPATQVPATGTTTSGQVTPDTGELPPLPELPPEDRERLLQGVNRLAPEAPRCDADYSSPPAR